MYRSPTHDPACARVSIVAMSVKHSPRILLPTDSAARVRKKDDMPGDGNSIDSEANPKSVQTDAREGARPLGLKNADADASQNCVDAGADKGIWIETPASCIPFPVC